MYELWQRYKTLLKQFPNHGLPDNIPLECFYWGLALQIEGWMT